MDTVFLSHPLGEGGLETTYDVRLGLIGKRVVDFLLMLIELFSLRVTAESYITSEKRSKIGDFAPTRQFDTKFQVKGVAPPIIFARIVKPMNALQQCR